MTGISSLSPTPKRFQGPGNRLTVKKHGNSFRRNAKTPRASRNELRCTWAPDGRLSFLGSLCQNNPKVTTKNRTHPRIGGLFQRDRDNLPISWGEGRGSSLTQAQNGKLKVLPKCASAFGVFPGFPFQQHRPRRLSDTLTSAPWHKEPSSSLACSNLRWKQQEAVGFVRSAAVCCLCDR